MNTPDFLCIGYLCHDKTRKGYLLGGTSSYASLAATNMEKTTAILTSVGEDFAFYELFKTKGIDIKNKKTKKTTVFANIYKNHTRIQFVNNPTKKLAPQDLPKKWAKAPIVLFGPIANEIELSFLKKFPYAITGATIQGWLRKWDKKGKVSPKKMQWKKLENVDIVFLSIDDIQGNKSYLKKIIKQAKIVVLTRGKKGAVVFHKNRKLKYPAYPTQEVDPTGCGDMFATAFLIKYAATKNIDTSAAFANAAASLVVEKIGTGIPSLKKINRRFEKYKKMYI